MESSYYEAISAAARCRRGEFKLCGRVLKPFSFRHSLQLDATENRLWLPGGDVPDEADFLAAAAICSSDGFAVLSPPKREELARVNMAAEFEAWRDYVSACYASRPRLWENPEPAGNHSKAPVEEFVITFILRHSHGYSRDWLETAPVGLVLWIFEAIGEQIGRSRILSSEDAEEIERLNSPAETKAREKREKIATEIFARVKDLAVRLRLLTALDAGKLSPRWKSELRKRPTSNVQRSTSKGKARKRRGAVQQKGKR